jgi:hypothetical protein
MRACAVCTFSATSTRMWPCVPATRSTAPIGTPSAQAAQVFRMSPGRNPPPRRPGPGRIGFPPIRNRFGSVIRVPVHPPREWRPHRAPVRSLVAPRLLPVA